MLGGMSPVQSAVRAIRPTTDRSEGILDELRGLLALHATAESGAIFEDARAAARPLLTSGQDALGYEAFIVTALSRLLTEGEADLTGLAETLEQARSLTGVAPMSVALGVVSDPAIIGLPLDVAAEACLDLLRELAPVRKVWLWMDDPSEGSHWVQPGGEFGVATILCWQRPRAAIIWLAERGGEAECSALAKRAAATLGPAFERSSLTEDNVARADALLSSSERRLTRLGFDLHDGPLQDVALLSGELAGVRDQVTRALGPSQLAAQLVDKLDDLAALVSFLDSDLRELALSIDSPGSVKRPFQDVVNSAVHAFSARTSIEPYVELTGEFNALTDSQRIALMRIVQESLTNVRDHSRATDVRVVIRAHHSYVEATIEDNGRGFRVEQALTDAARRGRMGLLGMMERVRLLGGSCDISSNPGVGTTVSVTIARWVAPAAEADEPVAESASA
jgi:signal transduction histidine kinase